MENAIIELIQYHLDMLDSVTRVSHRILKAAQNGNADEAGREADNRQRLLNIMGLIQIKTDDIIREIGSANLSKPLIETMKVWVLDFNLWNERIAGIDREITECLGQLKDETTQELASIFQNKEKFKGYNHSSMKK